MPRSRPKVSSPPRGSAVERFPFASARERWPDFLPLEHETLPFPLDFAREGDCFLVFRAPVPGRPIRQGRVRREAVASLFLQAAGAMAFFQAHGFWLDEQDLLDAHWEWRPGGSRLWFARSPAALRSRGPAPPASRALLALLEGPTRRGGRIAGPEARLLAESLARPDASSRRAEHWVSAAYRSFPALARAGAAEARERTAGLAGDHLRDARVRALIEKGRALLAGRVPRVFLPGASELEAGGALGLDPRPAAVAEASRRLRETAASETAAGQRPVWIAADTDCWDSLSRRAFETAARDTPAGFEIRRLPGQTPPPLYPDQWRREIFVPCGSLAASLRFYEWIASAARERPASAKRLALQCLRAEGWAAFAADPTGHAPLPAPAAGSTPDIESAPPDPVLCRRLAGKEKRPERRVELLLRAGAVGEALAEAERLYREAAPRCPEAWFELSARLAAAAEDRPAWLETLEAERELAGGRPEEAMRLLERAAASPGAASSERRAARLRHAEACARCENPSRAGRLAAAWREEFPEAAPEERVRALRLEARAFSREGEHETALLRLDEADRVAAGLPESERVENALARAAALSLQGRFQEEKSIYERWRAAALGLADEVLAARFLSQEALGFADRRDFAAAAARLEEALAVLRDDPGERARLLIDLAATLYHSGRAERCEALLSEAVVFAAAAGRQDLLRIARGNRVELSLWRCDWEAAEAEIEELLAEARREGDDPRLLVALHHRGRLALRRGELESAAADNLQARKLAGRLGDRLEIGELWLEEGDRRLYEEDREGARAAWDLAAADPPDRCDSNLRAAERLAELAWTAGGEPPAPARAELEAGLARGDYAAAERAARWRVLFGEQAVEAFRERAERVLRERGGGSLADRIFGRQSGQSLGAGAETLRALREALARALAGEPEDPFLETLGIEGLTISDVEGNLVARCGRVGEGDGVRLRRLEAGNTAYTLALAGGPTEEAITAAAFVAETLLFRLPASRPPEEFAEGWRRLGIVTGDTSMEEPYRRLRSFAARNVTVLVRGESGSGKEAVARAVHALSPRAAGPFVAVNVPAIPAALLESELFGHVRGAFTGAERDRVGLIEEAARGTIFFDEIGDLDPALQSKLLRALQDREVRRVGENRSRLIDVRVVSATSRDLAREVEAGRFREDLYYRLHVAVIALPPLRERGRDVLLLARHFLSGLAREYGRGGLRLEPSAAAALSAHSWPGNVRELQNAMAEAAALSDPDGVVSLAHLPEPLRRKPPREAPRDSYRSLLDAHRKSVISDALLRASGNRSRAARDLGLSRQALSYLMRELGVPARQSLLPRR